MRYVGASKTEITGKYLIKVIEYDKFWSFTLRSESKGVWTVSNTQDVECARFPSKKTVLEALNRYDHATLDRFNEQEFCEYA
jgi:hypothetical protein